MSNKDLYQNLFENFSPNKEEAIKFINYRINVAHDMPKMHETISANIDKLLIFCTDMKLELRLLEIHPSIKVNNQSFYSTKQAAEILDVSPNKIRELVSSGLLTVKKINQRNWKVPAWSLEAYKHDLTAWIQVHSSLLESVDVIEVTGEDNQLLIILLSKEAVHKVFEVTTKIKRTIVNIFSEL